MLEQLDILIILTYNPIAMRWTPNTINVWINAISSPSLARHRSGRVLARGVLDDGRGQRQSPRPTSQVARQPKLLSTLLNFLKLLAPAAPFPSIAPIAISK